MPPSPMDTSPTLTQSTSNSNSNPDSTSSASPPQPITPPPPRTRRSRTRYPDLGRVPLHRRGTSKTYERLEDLLREAGYKETRIFTPEGDRIEATTRGRDSRDPVSSSSDNRASVRDGVNAVVGFLAGLMPTAPANRSSDLRHSSPDGSHHAAFGQTSSPRTYSPPASPLAHKQTQKPRTPSSSDAPTPNTMTSSMESLVDPTHGEGRKAYSRCATPVPPNLANSHSHSSFSQIAGNPQHHVVHRVSDQYSYASKLPHLQPSASQSSLHGHPNLQKFSNNTAQPRPSRAGAYLRHIASAPNMPKRPCSAPVRKQGRIPLNNSDPGDPDGSNDNQNTGENEPHPPLPGTWFESIARAVLFGGAGAHVGRPTPIDSLSHPPRRTANQSRSTRSPNSGISSDRLKNLGGSDWRNILSDNTTAAKPTSSVMLTPPDLFIRLERGRAEKSEGEVTRTRVVCRSAPVSRAGSRVRSGGDEDRRAKQHGARKECERARGRREARDRLPSLARTKIEGDSWVLGQDKAISSRKATSSNQNRYLSGWGMDFDSEGEAERQSSSEDDEELDLARMLVPPKRQNSIKSLRKHLVMTDRDAGSSASANLMKVVTGMKPGQGVATVAATGSRSDSVRGMVPEDGSGVEGWGRGWVRKSTRRRNSEDDEGEIYTDFLEEARNSGMKYGGMGSGRSGTRKSRLGLPGPWGLIGGGS